MKFYFDESGDFRVPDDRAEHAVAVVVGVVIPESAETQLSERYRLFANGLSRSAFKDGEPKGSLLNDAERHAFAELISEFDDILICPIMLDLTTIAGKSTEIHDKIAVKVESIAPLCKYDTMRQEVTLLSRQLRKLSPQAGLRLGAWAQCIKRCVYDSVVFHSRPKFNNCWSRMSFVIDPVQPKKGSREERVFSTMLPGWVTAWSQSDPMMLIQEIHTPDHPFVKNWDTGTGIDLGKMFRDNIEFIDSSTCVGVQIADIAAYVARRAVVGVVTTDDLRDYGQMMSKSIRSSSHAHGIFSFGEIDEADISRRYYGIVAAVANARRSRRGAYALP